MKQFKSVVKWLGRLSPSSERVNLIYLRKFMAWVKENGGKFAEMNPDELVRYQKETGNGERYDVLDLAQGFALDMGGRTSTKKRAYATVKSFFMHNRAQLPLDGAFKLRGEPKSVGTLTIEEIKTLYTASNPVYQAITICLFQCGLGLAEFEYWNLNGFEDLKRQLLSDPDLIRIKLPKRFKTDREEPFSTRLGHDAIQALKRYLELRPKTEEMAIFLSQYRTPIMKDDIRKYLFRKSVKLGLITPKKNGFSGVRYGKNPHEMRDVFRSQWEKSPAKGSVAEFMMGHQVDPLEYNKAVNDPGWVDSEYRKAERLLNILSSHTPYGLVDENVVTQQERRISELEAQLDTEQRNKIEKDVKFRDLVETVNRMAPIVQTMIDEKIERDSMKRSARGAYRLKVASYCYEGS